VRVLVAVRSEGRRIPERPPSVEPTALQIAVVQTLTAIDGARSELGRDAWSAYLDTVLLRLRREAIAVDLDGWRAA
jgi:hypothetical protein